MKQYLTLVLLSSLLSIGTAASAQTTATDSTALKAYVGTYTFGEGSPVRKYVVTLNKGDLFGQADDMGSNKLVKKESDDTYQSTSSYGSVITFSRDTATKAITGFKMAVQGAELAAKKDNP
ncbi:DUF3471 domain-containing protein [Spirosoma luteum]|uniref:DUF3471 domain-containing protein n=1 Tax=Spirosoma luteum TaxID=431553 RepID=UPI00036A53FF|nr:DUF3471 domain-containing protein [Spirosoma luteum]